MSAWSPWPSALAQTKSPGSFGGRDSSERVLATCEAACLRASAISEGVETLQVTFAGFSPQNIWIRTVEFEVVGTSQDTSPSTDCSQSPRSPSPTRKPPHVATIRLDSSCAQRKSRCSTHSRRNALARPSAEASMGCFAVGGAPSGFSEQPLIGAVQRMAVSQRSRRIATPRRDASQRLVPLLSLPRHRTHCNLARRRLRRP